MRAVIVSEYGGSPHVEDLPPPEVQEGQVLINVLAAGMNPMDRAIAAGGWESIMPATFPMILGVDVAGTVERIGSGAERFSVGDDVFGQLLIRIGHEETRRLLLRDNDPARPPNEETFQDRRTPRDRR
jgi:NADPH:quinone reductase-like Zn-dependent oxidoreductase